MNPISKKISSKDLDDELRNIRENLTRSLGKKHGRIIRVATLPTLKERLANLQKKIEAHQKDIKKSLEETLKNSQKMIVNYYLPLVLENPPDELFGIFGVPTEQDINNWLESEIENTFPTADSLINKIQLEVNYKDVTFDTLNGEDFLKSIKEAYPEVDWDKAYKEFRAAGESK